MAFQSLYDEDLSANKFFAKLQREHKILIDTAPLENWIVCVPRSATITADQSNDTDFLLAHILIPHDEVPEHYTNLLGADVRQVSGQLHIHAHVSRILFEEIFYTKSLMKYKVWCIEWPLLTNTDATTGGGGGGGGDGAVPHGICIVRGLQDAIALIWTECNSKAMFRKIESICGSFVKNTNCADTIRDGVGDAKATPDLLKRIKAAVEMLLSHCCRKLMLQRRLYEKCAADAHFKRVFKIALETYVMDLLYRWLFDAISVACADETQRFNRNMRNLADATLKDFKIDGQMGDMVSRTRVELMKIAELTTPVEKMSCLRRALTTTPHSKHTDISVDDIIPIVVFVIIKSGLTHWITTLHYLNNFIFTEFTDSSDKGVDSYLLTTLEAAILYIQSMDVGEFKRLSLPPAEPTGQREFRTKSDFLDYLFGRILADDEVEIIKLLKTDKNVIVGAATMPAQQPPRPNGAASYSTSDDSDQSSDISFDAIARNGSQRSVATESDDGIDEEAGDAERLTDVLTRFPSARLNLANGHGIGAIHMAAMHGSAKMLNLLLALGVDVRRRDENGWTALHYAGARGHQNTLLLLLHAGSDINAAAGDRSTVLHLSSLNGNENCVKALLYYSDHARVRCDRNAQTRAGDTAVHVAAKWGFVEIVETLLEYGVRLDVRNRAGHLAVDLAHNTHVERLLQTATVPTAGDWSGDDELAVCEPFRGCYATTGEAALAADVAPFKQRTCNDKIVTAIRNEDTKLANHFLGVDATTDDEDKAAAAATVCHPLCDCDKCRPITEYLAQTATPVALQRKYDGDINEYSSTEGLTPLHAAVQMCNLEMVQRLLELGAAVSRRTRIEHQTAVHLAILAGSRPVLDLLLATLDSNGSMIVDAQDEQGDTAVHLACRRGDEYAVGALLKYAPNVRCRNNGGKSPVDVANEAGRKDIVSRLEAAEAECEAEKK